jgi:hypothetical protein
MNHPREEFLAALSTSSVLPYRLMLALASSLFSILIVTTAYATDNAPTEMLRPFFQEAYWRWWWSAVFALDAFLLWWRIFDGIPRARWALVTNLLTVSIWGGVTAGIIYAADTIPPGVTGYIVINTMAVQVLWRTQYTLRDRMTA